MARLQPENRKDHDQPGQGRPARLEHDGQHSKKGDSWFTGEKKGDLVHPAGDRRHGRRRRSTSSARSIPWMQGYGQRSLPRRPASGTAGQPSSTPRLGRRAFLGALGGGALAFLLPLRRRRRRAAARSAARRRAPAAAVPFRARLPIPRELTGAEIEIPIREAEAQILPGRKTRLWTYGGTFPGPTIRRPAGQRTEVTFHHELPAKAGELSRPPARRPQPHPVRRPARRPDQVASRSPTSAASRAASRRASPATTCCCAPGRAKPTSTTCARTGGPNAPRSSGTTTTASTAPRRTSGAAWPGCGSSTTSFDDSLPLPRGERDLPLMIADRSFDRHNQLTDPFDGGLRPPADGIVGQTRPRQRRLHAPPPGRAPAATGCGCSTSPSSAATTSTSPTARR